jgi:hypothetical protein
MLHVTGLRKTMLRAHRQAWAWQDEYHGLTIDDIRALERETQLALQEKMTKALQESEGEGTAAVIQGSDAPPTFTAETPVDEVNGEKAGLSKQTEVNTGAGTILGVPSVQSSSSIQHKESLGQISHDSETSTPRKKASAIKSSISGAIICRKQSWSSARSRVSGISGE